MGVSKVWVAVTYSAALKLLMTFYLKKPDEIITVRLCFGV